MKKLFMLMLAAIIVLSMVVLPVSANGQNVVNVSTVEQLENALASNTKIVLAPGRYVFKAEYKTEVWGDESYTYQSPKMLKIEGLENLTIEGNGEAEIVLDVGFAPVAEICNSSNIEISGLIMGHDVPEYGCEGEGYVISIVESAGITINDCDLYGCGVTGIYSWASGDIYVNRTTIRDCMINAVDFYELKGNLYFKNCVFSGNAYDDYSAKVTPCIGLRKAEVGPDVAVEFVECRFENNHSKMFLSDEGRKIVTTTDCTFSNNVWQSAINVKSLSEYGYWNYHHFQDQEPIVVEGRTLVPLRGVLQELGYHISWDDATKSATIFGGGADYQVVVTIDSDIIKKGDTEIKIDVPATIINDRTMVPIRAISEAFNLKVDWEDETRTVLISR